MVEPAYLTPEGLEKLKKELHELKTVKKRETAEKIEKAKELGDLSENAEYQDAKDEMAFIEGRILQLGDALNRAVLIEHKGTDAVSVGSTVELEANGQVRSYMIVGSNEADPSSGKISNESPIAQALLGKKVDEQVEVEVPSGKVVYTVVNIS